MFPVQYRCSTSHILMNLVTCDDRFAKVVALIYPIPEPVLNTLITLAQMTLFPGVGAVFAHPGLGRGHFFLAPFIHPFTQYRDIITPFVSEFVDPLLHVVPPGGKFRALDLLRHLL